MPNSTSAAGRAAIEVKNRPLLVLAVMMATIMQILDTTIANVALPHMQTSLGATYETVTWVLTSYIVAVAIAIPLTGWLADYFGSRRLFITAVCAFVIASMLCGIATNLTEMVIFRIIQGIAAAFIGPLAQTVILDINPPERHGKAMALWGMGVMVGPIMGPIIGGWLTDNYSWRWVFYINLPIGIITILLLVWLLPSRPVDKTRFDLFGFSMLALALAALQLVLDRGQHQDWLHSTEIIIEIAVAIAATWAFTIHIATHPKAIFAREVLTNRNLMLGMGFSAMLGLMMVASMALLPAMMQGLYGYSVLETGLLLAVRGLGIVASMFIAGQIAGRVDPRIPIAAGITIVAISMWQMTGWSLDMGREPIIYSGLVQGFGVGLIFPPLHTMSFATLPSKHRTDGAVLLNLTRSIGGSIGISLLTTMLARNAQVSHADLAVHITGYNIPGLNTGLAEQLGTSGAAALAAANAEITRQALMIAYLDDFYMMMIIAAVAVPLVLFLKPPSSDVGDQEVQQSALH